MVKPSTTSFRVRYAETDQMGVVYYSNYFIWCELGRVEYLRQLGFEYKEMEGEDGCMLPVVEANCRYKAPARYDDTITVETHVTGLRQHVIKFSYRILRAGSGELLAEAETVHVVVDTAMRKRPMPEKYAAAIRATMAAGSDSGLPESSRAATAAGSDSGLPESSRAATAAGSDSGLSEPSRAALAAGNPAKVVS
jgi:acyl-CoA thioester hydrolase